MGNLVFILLAAILIMVIIDLIKNKFSLVKMVMVVKPDGTTKPDNVRFWMLTFGFILVWMTIYYVMHPDLFKLELYMITAIITFAPKLLQKVAEAWTERGFLSDKP